MGAKDFSQYVEGKTFDEILREGRKESMGHVDLQVPKSVELLVGEERDRLLRAALRIAAKQRARELEKEQREALTHIRRYERKYGMPLAKFERVQLRKLDTVQAHEDYNDWFFWANVLERAERATSALKNMETIE